MPDNLANRLKNERKKCVCGNIIVSILTTQINTPSVFALEFADKYSMCPLPIRHLFNSVKSDGCFDDGEGTNAVERYVFRLVAFVVADEPDVAGLI